MNNLEKMMMECFPLQAILSQEFAHNKTVIMEMIEGFEKIYFLKSHLGGWGYSLCSKFLGEIGTSGDVNLYEDLADDAKWMVEFDQLYKLMLIPERVPDLVQRLMEAARDIVYATDEHTQRSGASELMECAYSLKFCMPKSVDEHGEEIHGMKVWMDMKEAIVAPAYVARAKDKEERIAANKAARENKV